MKRLIASVLITSVSLACVCVGPALAGSSEAPSKEAVAADVEAIKQLGQVMGDAMVAGDVDKLNQIYADDWASVTSSGKVLTKEAVLRNYKSGSHKLEWFELGPIDVQVLGNFAVAQGGVVEKRNWDGKDMSGQMIYADLLEKRAGKWVVVRSMGTKVK